MPGWEGKRSPTHTDTDRQTVDFVVLNFIRNGCSSIWPLFYSACSVGRRSLALPLSSRLGVPINPLDSQGKWEILAHHLPHKRRWPGGRPGEGRLQGRG